MNNQWLDALRTWILALHAGPTSLFPIVFQTDEFFGYIHQCNHACETPLTNHSQAMDNDNSTAYANARKTCTSNKEAITHPGFVRLIIHPLGTLDPVDPFGKNPWAAPGALGSHNCSWAYQQPLFSSQVVRTEYSTPSWLSTLPPPFDKKGSIDISYSAVIDGASVNASWTLTPEFAVPEGVCWFFPEKYLYYHTECS